MQVQIDFDELMSIVNEKNDAEAKFNELDKVASERGKEAIRKFLRLQDMLVDNSTRLNRGKLLRIVREALNLWPVESVNVLKKEFQKDYWQAV